MSASLPTARRSSWSVKKPSAWWRKLVDDFVVVDTDEVCAAIKDVFQDTRSILEPSGAMGVAAIKQYAAAHKCKGQTFVAITCGANMNFDRPALRGRAG